MTSSDHFETFEPAAPGPEAASSALASPPLSDDNPTQPTNAKTLPRIKIVNRPTWPTRYKDTLPSARDTKNEDDNDENASSVLPRKKHVFLPQATTNGISEVFVGRFRLPASHPDNAIPRNLAYTGGINRPQTSIYGFGDTLFLGNSTETAQLSHDHNGVITIDIKPDQLRDYLFGGALAEHGLDSTGWEFQILDGDGEYDPESDDHYQIGGPGNELVFCGRKGFQAGQDSADGNGSMAGQADEFDGMGWIPLEEIVHRRSGREEPAPEAEDETESSRPTLNEAYANNNIG